MSTSRLRVATLNLWGHAGEWPRRLAVLTPQLLKEDLDLIGLQEVVVHAVGDRAHSQAIEVAEGWAEHVAFGVSHGRERRQFGNALLSRHPIVSSESIPLPGEAGQDEPRSMLYCVVDSPAGLLPVVVTHLSWRPDHGRIRLRQVRQLVGVLADREPPGSQRLPPVVLGDFNAEPASDEMRYLTGLSSQDGDAVYFIDAWRYAAAGDPGFTFDPANCYAATTHEPPRRIDYVLVRGQDERRLGKPEEPHLAFSAPQRHPDGDREVFASDHFGVATTIWFEE